MCMLNRESRSGMKHSQVLDCQVKQAEALDCEFVNSHSFKPQRSLFQKSKVDLRNYNHQNAFSTLSVIYCSTSHTQTVAQRMQTLNNSKTCDIFRVCFFFPGDEKKS